MGAVTKYSKLLATSGVVEREVTTHRHESTLHSFDYLAEEVPVAIVVNGISYAVMMATPHDLEDFAVGFSITEDIVSSMDEIYGIEVLPASDIEKENSTA